MPTRSEPSADRDLVDVLSDAWRTEVLHHDRGEFAFVKRTARLGVLLEERMTSTLSPWGLTRADYGVLSTLRLIGAPHELKPSDLKARLLLTSGGVSNVLNRLEKCGYVVRERDGQDGRSFWVRLTPEGVEVATAIIEAWAAAQTAMFADVPADACATASDALRAVLVALGDREPAPVQRRLGGLTGRRRG